MFFYPLGDSPTSPVKKTKTENPVFTGKTEPENPALTGKTEPENPALAAKGTSSTSPTPLVQNGTLWGGVIGSIVLFVVPIALAIYKRKRRDTAGRDKLNRQQRRPLMTSANLGEF